MAQKEPERLAEMFSANIEAIKEELQGEMDKLQMANAIADRANRSVSIEPNSLLGRLQTSKSGWWDRRSGSANRREITWG